MLDDAEAAALWSASGAQWLTDPAVPVPGRLVRRVVGLADELDHRGARVDDLVEARGLGLLAERAAAMGLPRSGRTSAGGATRLVRAADGWVALSLARPDDIDSLPAWVDAQIRVPSGVEALGGGAVGDELWAQVERSIASRSAGPLVERAGWLGMACAAVGEVTDGRPVVAERAGDAPPRSLEGAVVVSLASLWAGPLCADLLARLGARVITVESTRRPDGGRLARQFFDALHGRSESVALDLGADRDRRVLAELLHRADVVIEGSRPRALEQMGIEARRVLATGPRVWLSITAHGRAGAAARRVGFGDDTAAAGGLVGWVGDEPRLVADAVADPLTGLTAACATAAAIEGGGRWLLDISLARTASSAAGGWVAPDPAGTARPRVRRDPGAPMPLGRDTAAVLDGLGVRVAIDPPVR